MVVATSVYPSIILEYFRGFLEHGLWWQGCWSRHLWYKQHISSSCSFPASSFALNNSPCFFVVVEAQLHQSTQLPWLPRKSRSLAMRCQRHEEVVRALLVAQHLGCWRRMAWRGGNQRLEVGGLGFLRFWKFCFFSLMILMWWLLSIHLYDYISICWEMVIDINIFSMTNAPFVDGCFIRTSWCRFMALPARFGSSSCCIMALRGEDTTCISISRCKQ